MEKLNISGGKKDLSIDYTKYIGQKINSLTPLEIIRLDQHKRPIYKCICECGNERLKLADELYKKRGVHLSCGCDYTTGKKIANTNQGFVLRTYINSSKKVGRFWGLTPEDAILLFESNCHYCGIEPSNISKKSTAFPPYFYNGIDRINNDVGYIKGNVVSCCKHCNFSKQDRDYNEFIQWGKRFGINLLEKERCCG